MSTTVAADRALFVRLRAWWPRVRNGERVFLAFSLYLLTLAWVRSVPLVPRLVLFLMPLLVMGLANWESLHSRPWTRVVRDWCNLGLILPAYWSVGWFASTPWVGWQEQWLSWDRMVLDAWGLRAAVEGAGGLIPSLLELSYLFLYVVPCICICFVYRYGGRERVNQFLYILLLGTVAAYALLPLFPVHGPHVVYPALDLPNFPGWGRGLNVWVLDHMDIPTSVFPSGHVAVAFSAAFGMLRAVRERPAIWGPVFFVASLVYVATVYCRYHYMVDGLASIGIAALAWVVSGLEGKVV